jgi:RNA polymerase sigma-70 factor (ECF subfamily)
MGEGPFHRTRERRYVVGDQQIVASYVQRDEDAIVETAKKHGAFFHKPLFSILTDPADAEECVNDAYFQAWNAIPPRQPERLGTWLGRVVRNNAYNLWKKNPLEKAVRRGRTAL